VVLKMTALTTVTLITLVMEFQTPMASGDVPWVVRIQATAMALGV
jgi:hypothetical protein